MSRSIKRGHLAALITALGLALSLGGCAQQANDVAGKVFAEGPLAVQGRADDGAPENGPEKEETKSYAPAGTVAPIRESSQPPRTQIFRGSGFVGKPDMAGGVQSVGESDRGVTLNFVNTDVKEVVRAVLGDLLGKNYVIGNGIQGVVTIRTASPVAREDVFTVLEQALRASGFALVDADGIYRVVTADQAGDVGSGLLVSTPGMRTTPGYGVEVIPVHYVQASEMRKLLEPLVSARSILGIDEQRNLIFVAGTQAERRTFRENVALFDVDWMKGMSFALFSPRYVSAEELKTELEGVVGGKESPVGRLVRLVPIARLNALLAISPQPRYLDRLSSWVHRLDRSNGRKETRLFIYKVQHGRAGDLAIVLSGIFGSSSRSRGAAAVPSAYQDTYNDQYPHGADVPAQPGSQSYGDMETDELSEQGMSLPAAGDVRITADEKNNSLVILSTADDYNKIEEALIQLDAVPLQVLLQAVIAEVTLTDALRYGVQYYFQAEQHNSITLSGSKTGAVSPTYPGFSYIFTDGTDIKVVLDALSSLTKVQVISSPEVMVLNNQTATLQVGDQVPIATQQSQSVTDPDAPVVNSIQYHDTGVILDVTPRVNAGGMVTMDISQEVSDVTPTDTSTLNSPTIQQRKIKSTVAIQDGETVALGGLMKGKNSDSKSGIPLLMDIPVVGNLFKSNDKSFEKTELIVLITPRVIDSVERARSVTSELRQRLQGVQPFASR